MEKEQANTLTRKLDLVGKTALGYEGKQKKKQGAKRVFTPPLSLLPARGLLSTKADLKTGFGKAYLDYSKTMDWFQFNSR